MKNWREKSKEKILKAVGCVNMRVFVLVEGEKRKSFAAFFGVPEKKAVINI